MTYMVSSFMVGMMAVCADFFKECCLSFPEALLKEFHNKLPKLINSKANQLDYHMKVHTVEVITVVILVLLILCTNMIATRRLAIQYVSTVLLSI